MDHATTTIVDRAAKMTPIISRSVTLVTSGKQLVGYKVKIRRIDQGYHTPPKVHFIRADSNKNGDHNAFRNVSQGFGEEVALRGVHLCLHTG